MAAYLTASNANSGGKFVTSLTTDRLLGEARMAAADFLGCTVDEVVFGANTTTINFLLAHAMARTMHPGDEIVVTELEHDANVAPWLLVATTPHSRWLVDPAPAQSALARTGALECRDRTHRTVWTPRSADGLTS